jgi:hypothetical protein
MRDHHRFRLAWPLAACVASMLTACAADPAASAPHVAPTPIASAAPVATTSATAVASASATSPPAPPPFCIPGDLVRADVARLSPSGGALELCVGDDPKTRVCASLDLATGEYSALAAPITAATAAVAGAVSPRRSSDGAWTLETSNTQVKVCKPTGDDCRTVALAGFAPTELADTLGGAHVPADVSADGATLFIARHEGRKGEKIFGESYDLSTGRRLARFSLRHWDESRHKALDYVPRVEWVGKRVLVTDCTEYATGCIGMLVEPRTGAARTLEIDLKAVGSDVYGLDMCAERSTTLHAKGDTWVFFDCVGRYALALDVEAVWKDTRHPRSAVAEARILTGMGGGVSYVARPGTTEAFVVYDTPSAGSVDDIDLVEGATLKSFEPRDCNDE